MTRRISNQRPLGNRGKTSAIKLREPTTNIAVVKFFDVLELCINITNEH